MAFQVVVEEQMKLEALEVVVVTVQVPQA